MSTITITDLDTVEALRRPVRFKNQGAYWDASLRVAEGGYASATDLPEEFAPADGYDEQSLAEFLRQEVEDWVAADEEVEWDFDVEGFAADVCAAVDALYEEAAAA